MKSTSTPVRRPLPPRRWNMVPFHSPNTKQRQASPFSPLSPVGSVLHEAVIFPMSSSSSPFFFFLDEPNPRRPAAAVSSAATNDDRHDDLPRRTFVASRTSPSLDAARSREYEEQRFGGGGGAADRQSAARREGGDEDEPDTTDDDDDGGPAPTSSSARTEQLYRGLRQDEADLIRDCWFAARGIDSERLQFVTKEERPARKDEDGKGAKNEDGGYGCCCRRHLSLAEGRTHSVALRMLLDDRMHPLFVGAAEDGAHAGGSPRSHRYWSLLGSGAGDAIQIIGQAGAAWRDVEACQLHLLGSDGGGTGGPSRTFNVDDSLAAAASGIRRALATALEEELQSIRVAMKPHQIDKRLDAHVFGEDDEIDGDEIGGGGGGGGGAPSSPTLRRFLVQLMPLTSRLVALQNLGNAWRQHVNLHADYDITSDDDDDDETPSGSIQLLNLILAQSRSGDPRIAELCQTFWRAAVQPWYRRLHSWITQGRVTTTHSNASRHDVFFFVEAAAGVTDVAPKDLWRLKFRLRAANVPNGTLTPRLVKSAFLIGKGINYYQTCLGGCLAVADDENAGVSGGIENQSSMSEFPNQPELYFSRLIQSASSHVHSQILEAMHTDHKLLQHMLALKQFLLLGQGDFVSAFMASLMDEFGSGNNAGRGRKRGNPYVMPGMHRHALNEVLDAALRGSNAIHFSNDVLKRLQVVLVNPANIDGDDEELGDYSFSSERRSTVSREQSLTASTESVWDRVSFSYTIPDPLVAIVPQSSTTLYTKLFRFLFSVRRIEMLLNLTWRQSSLLQQEVHTCAQRCAIHVSEHETYAQANILLRQIAMTRQAMMHFCLNLNSYLMYEVLETEWKRLVRAFEAASTLDELIAAHDVYLNCVYRKSLLAAHDEVDGEDLGRQLHELLRLVNAFCAYQERVFGEALAAVQRAADKRRRAEEQQSSGEWGFKSEIEEEESFFGLSDPSKLHDLEYLSSVFDEKIVYLLRTLDRRLNGGQMKRADEESTVAGYGRQIRTYDQDLDSLRFLEFQLNHNGYYTSALDE